MLSVKHCILLFLCLCIGLVSAEGQSWRKLRKQAEAAYEQGNYAQAAEAYEQAWNKKKKKEELIYKAGEAYYLIRDYRKAAAAYQNVKDMNEEFPLVGLKYARSIKQDGRYDQAIQAFNDFSEGYTGEGKAILEDIIQTEIEGCELGKELPARADPDLELNYLGAGVNTDEDEFAPIALSSSILYYSSDMGGRARIYRSTLQGEEWTKGATPENFPVIQDGQYCHGSLTPDGGRFYFTICEESENFSNQQTRCEIYVITRQGGAWSQPELLPDFINQEGVTSTQPNIVHRGDVEIMYFASNRGGGRGGMDLWYVTRSLRVPNAEFSQPVNLGPTINTLGDEMTPSYNNEDGVLHFASNGHVSIGGFDIMRSKGDLVNWTAPENAGIPYNSSADDYYYTGNPGAGGGFFVSNRIYAGEKLSTTQEDIFEFRTAASKVTLQGNVFDQSSGEALTSYTVTIFEVQENGDETNLVSETFDTQDGYSFQILPNRQFRVEVSASGYDSKSYEFTSSDPNAFAYGQPIFLEPVETNIPPTPEEREDDTLMKEETMEENPMEEETAANTPETDRPEVPASGESVSYTTRGTSPYDQLEYSSTAPRYEGMYYKVQLAALRRYNPDDTRYDRIRGLGDLQSEFILSRDLNRVLLGTFFSAKEARTALSQVQNNGFSGAFIVRYENGQRYGRVQL